MPKSFHGFPKAICLLALVALFPTSFAAAQNFPPFALFRQPLGIYARDVADCNLAPGQTAEQCLKAKAVALVSNPAVSGLNPELGWMDLNPSFGTYDWTELDVVFQAVGEWNWAHPDKPRKTVQIDVNPGFHAPPWVFDNMSSCDPMFGSMPEANPDGTLNKKYVPYPAPIPSMVSRDCGYVTFLAAEQGNNPPLLPLPLPWNPFYKYAWRTFVRALAQKYGSNPDLVSVTIAGPTSSSSEMILPNEKNDPADFYKWNYLLALTFPPSYQNSDQVFVEAWYEAVDLYSEAFSGLTLVVTTGNGLPNFLKPDGLPYNNYSVPPGFQPACGSSDQTVIMDCAAEESVVAYFADPLHGGFNLKSSQENGLGAGGIYHNPLGGGDLGAYGISWLAETSENGITRLPGTDTFVSKIFGGLQSGGDLTGGYPQNDTNLQDQGCDRPGNVVCPVLTPEQGVYNFLADYFDGTKAGAYYGPDDAGYASGPGISTGMVPKNYLQMYDVDIMYANANACDIPLGACTQATVIDGAQMKSTTTFQQELEVAAQQILEIADPTIGICSFF